MAAVALAVETLTRDLVNIDSTTGREHEVAMWLAGLLRNRGYRVSEQPVADGRFNVFAQLEAAPRVVFSTHFDCVPPFVPSRQERGVIFGRGSCDAKGILAAQVMAVERLRAAQGVLRLRKSYAASRLEAACARALAHESPYYRTVKTILAGGHDLRRDDWGGSAPETVPHSGRFARNAASLFAAPDTVQ